MKSYIVRANGREDVVTANASTLGELTVSDAFRSVYQPPAGSTMLVNSVPATNATRLQDGDVISWQPPVGQKG